VLTTYSKPLNIVGQLIQNREESHRRDQHG
jgi:hypothetical protein